MFCYGFGYVGLDSDCCVVLGWRSDRFAGVSFVCVGDSCWVVWY